jgi:TonB family protein
MPLRDFTPRNLVCLATSFQDRYRDRQNILVYVFSSYRESKGIITQMEFSEEDVRAFQLIHAVYKFDAAKPENHVRVLPAGAYIHSIPMDGYYSTTINLPATGTPHCRLEINNRCLVAMDYVAYPGEARRLNETGTIVVAATVGRSGKVGNVRVVETESVPGGAQSQLAIAAVYTLSNWTFEPGLKTDAIQIAFSYSIDNSLRHVDGTQVEWDLPRTVTIRAAPE